MASAYTNKTAMQIYSAIAEAGEAGLDIEQVMARTGLARNTICTYGREMAREGAIEIEQLHSPARNRPMKNLYLAVRPPEARKSEAERLKEIAELLQPFEKPPESWDKQYKSEIHYVIQEVLNIAYEHTRRNNQISR